MEYKRLTKTITLENGKKAVTCVHFGTSMCQKIHSKQNCGSCPMFASILNQLSCFEDVYTEQEKENNKE